MRLLLPELLAIAIPFVDRDWVANCDRRKSWKKAGRAIRGGEVGKISGRQSWLGLRVLLETRTSRHDWVSVVSASVSRVQSLGPYVPGQPLYEKHGCVQPLGD